MAAALLRGQLMLTWGATARQARRATTGPPDEAFYNMKDVARAVRRSPMRKEATPAQPTAPPATESPAQHDAQRRLARTEVLDCRNPEQAMRVLRKGWKSGSDRRTSKHPTQVLLSDYYELEKRGLLGAEAILYMVDALGPKLIRHLRKVVWSAQPQHRTPAVLHAAMSAEASRATGDNPHFQKLLVEFSERGFRFRTATYNAVLLYLRNNRKLVDGAEAKFRDTLRKMSAKKLAFDSDTFSCIVAMSPPDHLPRVMQAAEAQGVPAAPLAPVALEACQEAALLGGDAAAAAARAAEELCAAYGPFTSPDAVGSLLRLHANLGDFDKSVGLYRGCRKVKGTGVLTAALLHACERAAKCLTRSQVTRFLDIAQSAFEDELHRCGGRGPTTLWAAIFNVYIAAGDDFRMREVMGMIPKSVETRRTSEHKALRQELSRKYDLFMTHREGGKQGGEATPEAVSSAPPRRTTSER